MTEPTVRVERLPEAPDLPQRLGRHLEHDERSRGFAFAPPEPRPIVDVAWRRRVGPYNQNDDVHFFGVTYHGLGSCTFNGLCGALSTLPHRHRFRSQQRIAEGYSEATKIDPFPGEFPTEDTGSSGLAVAKVALSRRWISEYRHIFSFDDFLQAMMVGPVITGTAWRSQMFYPEPSGQVRPTGSGVGGHEYEAFGIDATEHRVWFWNSWGARWSIGGRFWMSFEDFRGLLADDGDATVLVP